MIGNARDSPHAGPLDSLVEHSVCNARKELVLLHMHGADAARRPSMAAFSKPISVSRNGAGPGPTPHGGGGGGGGKRSDSTSPIPTSGGVSGVSGAAGGGRGGSRSGSVGNTRDGGRDGVGTAQWIQARREIHNHHHIRLHVNDPNFDANHYRSDFHRLARWIRGTSVGVVLGGGGARGLAHLGVRQIFIIYFSVATHIYTEI
jgi:hypothetical protein